MIKVVIQGASGLKNSGDEAILQSMLQQMNESYKITVVTFDVSYSKIMHPNISFVKMGSQECKQAVRDCEIFILGGGGLLQDETSVYNVSRWLRYLRYCVKKGKKTYLYANSIGPVRFKINKMMIRKWLTRVDRITVRDEISLKLLKDMNIRDNVEITADPVFSLQKEDDIDISRFALPNKYVVICVRHWYDTHAFIPVSICTKLHIRNKKNKKKYRKYIKNIAWLADYLTEKYHLPVVFLPFLYGRDNHVMKDINCCMKNTGILVDDKHLTPFECMEIIGSSELLIGMRLHSIIYGAVLGIPAFIISYSTKVRGMAEYLKMEKYALDVDSLKKSEMADVIKRMMENKTQIKNDLNMAVAALKKREKRNQEILKELQNDIIMERVK